MYFLIPLFIHTFIYAFIYSYFILHSSFSVLHSQLGDVFTNLKYPIELGDVFLGSYKYKKRITLTIQTVLIHPHFSHNYCWYIWNDIILIISIELQYPPVQVAALLNPQKGGARCGGEVEPAEVGQTCRRAAGWWEPSGWRSSELRRSSDSARTSQSRSPETDRWDRATEAERVHSTRSPVNRNNLAVCEQYREAQRYIRNGISLITDSNVKCLITFVIHV